MNHPPLPLPPTAAVTAAAALLPRASCWLLFSSAVLALLTACGGSVSDPAASRGSRTQYLAQSGAAATGGSSGQAGGIVPLAYAPGLADFYAPGPQFPDRAEHALQSARQSARPVPQALVAQDGSYTINPENREAVRLFYRTVFASSEGVASGWNGNIANCNAGDTSAAYKSAILRRINWFRAMAGVPANVQWDATYNANAQQAAMLMSANNSLSHSPPTSWKCYNATGAQAAGKSNINLGSAGAAAITGGYLRDPGANNTAAGHRRWVLHPQTRFMGTGDVEGSGATAANALWVQDANIFGTRPAVRDDFVAWPAKGYAPYTTVYPRWSFAYPSANFSAAVVSMKENGVPIAVKQETIANGYGENTIVWFPGSYTDGSSWARPTADTSYQVTVSNVTIAGQTRSFTYTVKVFDPDQEPSDVTPLTISGNGSVNASVPTTYTFGAVAGATDYQWRSLSATPYSLDDGAEQGTGNFSASTSASYQLISGDFAASGSKSFHFAHPDASDQILQVKANLIGTANAALSFRSRLGLATSTQTARVEISTDDGKNWLALWQQAGTGQGETAFSVKNVALAQYADKTVLLRFRYVRGNGTYYPQTSSGIGWYVDDIHLAGVETLAVKTDPAVLNASSFTTSFATNGTVLLQARAGMYGYYGNWSAVKRVTVSNQTIFNGTSGNDVLYGYGGWTLDGGAGMDIAQYDGLRAAYQIVKAGSGFSVSGAHGSDTLSNIERIHFNDKIVALDIDGNAGQAYRIYQAAFNRQPDIAGLKYWVGVLDAGSNLQNIATGFISSAEFNALYGANATVAQFVTRLYSNVLHRDADQGGFNYWSGLLNNGTLTRAQVLSQFAESPENRTGVSGAIENGIELTP